MERLESKFDHNEVIADGHPPVARKVALIDFDGTLFDFGEIYGPKKPTKGAAKAVRDLKKAGYRIVICTSRLSKAWHYSEGWPHREAVKQNKDYILDVCTANSIPVDDITAEKIPAEVFFDDKAVRVDTEYTLATAIGDFLNGRV